MNDMGNINRRLLIDGYIESILVSGNLRFPVEILLFQTCGRTADCRN